jgi:DeoR family transcriptional regulator, suf operon transcriptional repressor
MRLALYRFTSAVADSDTLHGRRSMLKTQLLDSSRGRIVTLLRGTGLMADDLASKLGVTRSAVRAHLSAMERDGMVRRVGQRPGTTRPSLIFKLTAAVEQLLSGAYIPLLTQLVDVFAEGLPADQLETLLRKAGQRLDHELVAGERLGRGLTSRVHKASELMNEHLSALTQVEVNGEIVIKGAGCPLAALTGKHRGVCLAMESFVTEIVGVPVRECCERGDGPRCCFEIQERASRRATQRLATDVA